MSGPPFPPSPGRVAGVDYGTLRIGIAMTDPDRTIATPYENYTRQGRDAEAALFRRIVEEERVKLFVVGLPVHLSGDESPISLEARRFGRWLEETTGVPVEYFDERFTSTEAERFLLAAKMTKKRRKERMDKLAAQIMLAGWLESRGRGGKLAGPLGD